MKRLIFAAVAGLCSFTSLRAQETTLAPTVPVVPAPTLQNGGVLTPAGGTGLWGASSPRLLSLSRWSPLRSPVFGSASDAVALPANVDYSPTLPNNAYGAASCAPASCGRDRSCLSHLKQWFCYTQSKSDLPKLRPTPYICPLQGMFPCTSSCNYGCGTGCATAPGVVPPTAMPQPQPTPPAQMPKPMPPAEKPQQLPPPKAVPQSTLPAIPQVMHTRPSTTAGAVMMPAGDLQGGSLASKWKPVVLPGTIVPASAKVPVK